MNKILRIDFKEKLIVVNALPDPGSDSAFRQQREDPIAFLKKHMPPDFELIDDVLHYIPSKRIINTIGKDFKISTCSKSSVASG